MRVNASLLVLVLGMACGAMRAEARSPEQKCSVVIDSVQLSYNHQGGESKPQLRVEFSNDAGKQISQITLDLYLLDAGGNPQPYPDELTYQDGLGIGKKKSFLWDLARESVDIHRTGETVVVKKVEFINGKDWIDDGSESCAFTVDFHAR
ncbi:MAG: hypothetical protein ABR905_01835 [Terracidiphilus sp.]|jgi:hypothetical protein